MPRPLSVKNQGQNADCVRPGPVRRVITTFTTEMKASASAIVVHSEELIDKIKVCVHTLR